MPYHENDIDMLVKGYEMVHHMGETFYVDRASNIAYMLCSFYKCEDEEPERVWRLEEVGTYDIECSRIMIED